MGHIGLACIFGRGLYPCNYTRGPKEQAAFARSEATKQSKIHLQPLDCFASLAMTAVPNET